MLHVLALILLVLSSGLTAQAQTSPQVVSLQGRILDPSNNALESVNVAFIIEILSPNVDECVLFKETYTLNMTGSGGVFSLPIGAGLARVGANFEDTSTLAQVFNNGASAMTSLTCATAVTSYTPATTHKRKIRMSFNDIAGGGGQQVVTQLLDLQSVPFALYADTLQGKGPLNFVQTNTDTTQSKVDALMLGSAHAELLALINGTTTQYAKVNGSNFLPIATVNFNNQRITNLAAPTVASDAVNKTYSDTKFGGANLDLTGLANGQTIRWDSAGTKWEVYTPSTLDATKLPLAGGTMAGAINMAGFDVLATGHITMSPQKVINLGTYTNAQEATLAAGLAVGNKGATWFNSDANQMKYWTGTAVAVVGSGNGTAAAANVGTAENDITTNINIPHCLANQKLEMSLAPIYTLSCQIDNATDATKLPLAGGTMTGAILNAAGTASLPSLSFAGDSDTGWWRAAADTIAASTAGAERVRIDSAGNVGVGTTSPSAKLSVATVDGLNSAAAITTITNNDVTNGEGQGLLIKAGNGSADLPLQIQNRTGAYVMSVDAFGTLDAQALTAAGGISRASRLNIRDGGTSWAEVAAIIQDDETLKALSVMNETYSTTAGNGLEFWQTNAGVGRIGNAGLANPAGISIATTGNVGVGTTNPTYRLEVQGPNIQMLVNGVPNATDGYIAVNAPTANQAGILLQNNGSDRWYFFRDSSDSLGYTSYDGTTYNRRMTMQLGGNVGIGLTGPGYKLDVNGDVNIAAANVLRFGGTQVCASAGCTAVSDRRLKEDIQPLEDSLDNILKLQGVSYNWIDKEKYGQSQQIGLIAQDLEKVYPQAVITDSKSGLKSVAYDHLVAPLIEAFKSLNGRLNELYNLFAKISAEQARDIASIKSNDAAKDQKIEALEQENAEIKARLEKIEKALNSK